MDLIQYKLGTASCSSLSISSHEYSTEFSGVPTHFSFGTPMVDFSGGTPFITISKLGTFVPDGEQTFTATIKLKTSVTVTDSSNSAFHKYTDLTHEMALTMTEDGCGTVTFVETDYNFGNVFIVQALPISSMYTVEIFAPKLSVSTACGITYTETIKKWNSATSVYDAWTDYDKSVDVIYGAVYDKAGENK